MRSILIISFLTLSLSWSFSVGLGNSFAQENKEQLLMSSPVDPAAAKVLGMTSKVQSLVDALYLKAFEAAVGDLSVCNQDKICLTHAKRMKEWQCIINVCAGVQNENREPITCFEEFAQDPSSAVRKQLNSLICPYINSSDSEIRKKILSFKLETDADQLVEMKALILAMTGSASACENYIKDYVGEYGPKWNYRWYRALSGCRILSKQSTRQAEEESFYAWYASQEKWTCSNIINKEISQACQTAGAVGPRLPEDSSQQNIETLINHLSLKSYSAAAGQKAQCQDDKQCQSSADLMQPWVCLGYVCGGIDTTRKPTTCFKNSTQYAMKTDDKEFDEKLCSLLELPDNNTRQTLINHISGIQEEDLNEYVAYVLALKSSAGACRNYIKKNVGSDLSKWSYRWYRALSGCNILAGETTVELEEAGYFVWYLIERNFSCSDIKNEELQQACRAPHAGSPQKTNDK